MRIWNPEFNRSSAHPPNRRGKDQQCTTVVQLSQQGDLGAAVCVNNRSTTGQACKTHKEPQLYQWSVVCTVGEGSIGLAEEKNNKLVTYFSLEQVFLLFLKVSKFLSLFFFFTFLLFPFGKMLLFSHLPFQPDILCFVSRCAVEAVKPRNYLHTSVGFSGLLTPT